MSTAIYAENAIPPDKTFECAGEISYGNRLFRCHIRKPGHGHLDLKNGFAQSCDVYYWLAGRDSLGVDMIASYSKEFGFGQSTEIDLPSQTEGFIPTPQWKERRFHEKWLGGDTMNMSIGQGFMLTSPLQVANMVSMAVNSGTVYTPHLLKEVRDPVTNEAIVVTKPEVLYESNIPEAVWRQVREDMRYMVSDGSAQFPLRNRTVQIAGKTGTGEVGVTDRWHSWFAAYGPYDAPPEDALVVVMLVEAVNEWEWWAPYGSNIIFQGIFGNQTYEDAVRTLGFESLGRIRGRQE
jgi:penicillin-binding protein 2